MQDKPIIYMTENEFTQKIEDILDKKLDQFQKLKSPDEYIDFKELKEITGRSTNFLRKLMDLGDLPYSKIGKMLYFKKSDVELLFKNNKQIVNKKKV